MERNGMIRILAAVASLALLHVFAAPVGAKDFKYASGPQPPADTAMSVADREITPIVRQRGPTVPYTNLQMVGLVANRAIDRALQAAPLDSGIRVMVAPAESHPLNFLIEHAVLRHLTARGITATVRRAVIPDDSLMTISGNPGEPLLEYQLATARISYLRLVGWLPFSGRVKIERQAMVEGGLTLRDPRNSVVLWVGDASHNLVDAFPRDRLQLVEDQRFTDLTSPVPSRDIGKVLEPIVVVAIVGGLIALFFQNRP
jgi:hypothetical protein